MVAITRPALRYHGGKFRLAPWIMSFFPCHKIYTEAFGGAASVLLRKPRSYAEVYNDLDADVVNFFRVLRDPDMREKLIDACAHTPYARDEFNLAWKSDDDAIERARRLCVRAMMGFGSAGATKGSTGLRIDTKRRYTTAMMDWARYPAAIAAAGERLSGVLIENRPALDVLRQHDADDSLHYVDPPYLHGTRVFRSKGGYRHEMTDDDHAKLLGDLDRLKGYVVLSGYASSMYDQRLKTWMRISTSSRISAGRGTAVREEVVWINPQCAAALAQERERTGS